MKGLRQRLFPLLLGLLPVLVLADSLALLAGVAIPLGSYVVLWLVLVGLATASAIPHGRRAMLAGAATFAVVGALLYCLPWHDAKRFYRGVARLERGMTRDEVARSLSRCASQSEDPFLRSHREDAERWYSDPWFAVCDVVYDDGDRLAQVSTFAYDAPWDAWVARGGGSVRVAP